MAIAVDFGTSNTVVARWNPGTEQAETLALPGLSGSTVPPLVPSLVYVEKPAAEGVLVGQAVRDRGLDLAADPRFFANIKRGIGAPLQGFLPEIDGAALSFEQLGEWFLRSLLTQVRQVAGDDDSLVLTVPVDSFEAYRLWLGDVAAALEFKEVRLIDEPTAAALGYGLSGEQTLLVLDFGGGTLDWSLVRLVAPAQRQPTGFLLKWRGQGAAQKSAQKPEVARVLAKAGENLGGADIDQWLGAHFAAQGVPDGAVVRRLAEKIKIALSDQTEAAEAYFDDTTFDTYDLALTRPQFEAILSQNQFFERLEKGLTQVIQQGQRQGIDQSQIDAVLLVGGTAQIPAVQRWAIDRFGAELVRCDRPFEAVAQGALQIAQGLAVEDFLYHSYGIRYWDRRHNRHSWHAILPEGQPYPMGQPVELTLGASVEKQPSIELIIGEIGAASTQTEVYFENGRLVTQTLGGSSPSVQPLNDREGARTIAQLNPPGFPGSDRVRVLFRVDRDRLLCITVEDILTGDTLLDNQPVVRLS
ncbi:MAG: Hsp70 family protein [Leptolyngbya sp. DLM2.Bin27]|nr:MAG: Hsp70 family protein [Leptolyngbya sp. DLM2.Bin27]